MALNPTTIEQLENGKLRKLDLSCQAGRQPVGHDDLRDIQFHVTESKNLRILDLSGNNLDDAAMEILAPMLAQNRSLREINLSGNSFSDQAMTRLASALENHPTLMRLDVGKNPFTREGIAACAPILNAPQLAQLILHDGIPPADRKEEFEAAMPLISDTVLAMNSPNINRIAPPTTITNIAVGMLFRRNMEEGTELSNRLKATPAENWSLQLINEAAARHGIIHHLHYPHDMLDDLDDALDTLPYFTAWKDITTENLTTRNEAGLTPLDNPKFWNLFAKYPDRMPELSKADLMQPNRDGEPAMLSGVIAGKTEAILNHLHARGEMLTPDDLLDEKGWPNELLATMLEARTVQSLFTLENWGHQGKAAMRKVFDALPEEAQESITNLHTLSALMRPARFASNTPQIGL